MCPFESIMTPPYFGWEAEYVATGIQIVAKVMQTLEKDDYLRGDEYFVEAEKFLRELEATLKDIQKYETGFPSGQLTTDITRLLQIIKSPFDRFVRFVEEQYPTLAISSQNSESTGGPQSEKWSLERAILSSKVMELMEATSHSLRLVHTLLLLHSL